MKYYNRIFCTKKTYSYLTDDDNIAKKAKGTKNV